MFCAKKMDQKWAINRVFLNLILNSLNLFYNENLYYLLWYCTNPIGWNLVPEIWAKMLSANQISRFLNQIFLQKNLRKQTHFWHVDTNSQKLNVDRNVLVVHGKKWVWLIWSLDSVKLAVSQKYTDGINWFFAC